MEVRIGSIYALARIARENLSFHVQIMQILCAYIRENSPASKAKSFDLPEMPNEAEVPTAAWEDWRATLLQYIHDFKPTLKRRTDIQAAVEVLGRRTQEQRNREAGWPDPNADGDYVFDKPYPVPPEYPAEYTIEAHKSWSKEFQVFRTKAISEISAYRAYGGYRLDLGSTNLQSYDLGELDLRGATLNGAKIQCANFRDARFQGANLERAQMQSTIFWRAEMQGADFEGTQMQGAVLTGAQMQGATLERAQMQGASLARAQTQGADFVMARMQGADLSGAQMQGAHLADARMQGANLSRAQMQGAGLRDVRMQGTNLRAAQMQGAEFIAAQMSEETDLANAVLKGALVRSVVRTTIEKLRPFWTDIFADGTVVIVPDGERPAHWPTEELVYSPWNPEDSLIHIEYYKWLSNPASYTPPKPGTHD
jgi:uncharacterized protein YjbI with pentapeptide repeats